MGNGLNTETEVKIKLAIILFNDIRDQVCFF